MKQYIDKSAVAAELEKRMDKLYDLLPDANSIIDSSVTISTEDASNTGKYTALESFRKYIDTLEVIEPYEHLIQYPSREDGIKAHAEDYSWNIENELFQQLTPEQQKLWRKEIEQACISGGYCGLNLQKDRRYNDNLELKEVDLDTEQRRYLTKHFNVYDDGILQSKKSQLPLSTYDVIKVAKHFFELGLKAQKGEEV